MEKLELLLSDFNQQLIRFGLLISNKEADSALQKELLIIKDKVAKLQRLLTTISQTEQLILNQEKSLIDITVMLYQIFEIPHFHRSHYLIEINSTQFEALKNLLKDLRVQLIPQRADIKFRRRGNDLVLTCLINHDVLKNIPHIIQTTEMLKTLAKYLKGRVRVAQSSKKEIIYLTISFAIISPAKIPV